jgi:glycosyltransferase involved in cell wall biosynthesis
MKLLFVARAIDRMPGGVERMVISIMNAMAERGHDVSLFSWDGAAAAAFYPMSPDVTWRRLDMGDPKGKAGIKAVAARFPIVRKLVKNLSPDVIVCFQGGPFRAVQLYTAGLGIPLVAAERTSPAIYEHTSRRRLRFVEHQAFRFARRIMVQFERYRDLYPRHLRSRIAAVPNPVPEAGELARPGIPAANGRFRLLSVGRLSYQKNYDVLIDAFAALAPRFPDWDLRIVGEGGTGARWKRRFPGSPDSPAASPCPVPPQRWIRSMRRRICFVCRLAGKASPTRWPKRLRMVCRRSDLRVAPACLI